MKTRIIEETKCGKSIYKVQYKFLFLWFTVKMYGIGYYGENHALYDLTFDSKVDAKKYICENYSKPIIKII